MEFKDTKLLKLLDKYLSSELEADLYSIETTDNKSELELLKDKVNSILHERFENKDCSVGFEVSEALKAKNTSYNLERENDIELSVVLDMIEQDRYLSYCQELLEEYKNLKKLQKALNKL